MNSSRVYAWAAVSAIMIPGLLLRTWQLGSGPFPTPDEVRVAHQATWNYPYPKQTFFTTKTTLHAGLFNILSNSRGSMPTVLAIFWLKLLSLLGLTINEFSINLLFALIGTCAIVLAYALGATWQSRRSGVLAALFVAVMPFQVLYSRSSGESVWILIPILQAVTLLAWWQYLKTGRAGYALVAGLAMGLDAYVDYFPALIAVLLVLTAIHDVETEPRAAIQSWMSYARERCMAALRRVWCWHLLVPLLISLTAQVYLLWQSTITGGKLGMHGRVLQQVQETEHVQVGGFYLRQFLEHLARNTNGIAVVMLGLCVGAMVVSRRGKLRASLPLVWAAIYSVPVLFLVSRKALHGQLSATAFAGLVFVAVVLDVLWTEHRVGILAGMGAGALAISLLLTSLNCTFRVSVPGGLTRVPGYSGVTPDPGTKAAALCIRQNSPESVYVFAYPYALQGKDVAAYYYRRAILSMNLGQEKGPEVVYDSLAKQLSKLDVIVIGVKNQKWLPAQVADQFRLSAIVTVKGKPKLHILTRAKYNETPDIWPVETYNAVFDQRYGGLWQQITYPCQEMSRPR